MAHSPEVVCSCRVCTLLDVMYGDPRMTPWERRFVQSVAEWGWHGQYSRRQVEKVEEVFERARKRWVPVWPAQKRFATWIDYAEGGGVTAWRNRHANGAWKLGPEGFVAESKL